VINRFSVVAPTDGVAVMMPGAGESGLGSSSDALGV
jgi:hypothetical protein